jgi:hypothetical protein
MGIKRGPSIVTNGLVFAIDAANPSSYVSGSTLWKDQTVNQNNGTLTNGPTFDSADEGSIDFDGVNDYVDFGNPTELQFTTSFSISLWFKSSDTSDYILICKDKTNGHLTNERSWGLWGNRYGGTNVIIFNIRSGSTGFSVAGTTDYNDGNWHHVVATFEASTNLKLYVDGSLEAENPQWNLPATINNVTTNVGIGTSIGSNLWYMNGKISNIQLYTGALSTVEVLQNYNALKGRFGL